MTKKAIIFSLLSIFAAGSIHADYPEYGKKFLFIHGKTGRYCYSGETEDCYKDGSNGSTYWKQSSYFAPMRLDVHDFYVGWNGRSDPRDWGSYVDGYSLNSGTFTGDGPYWNRAQTQIHAALFWGNHPVYGGAWCQNPANSCWVACHSTGCMAIDYYLANFNPAWENNGNHLNYYATFAGGSATGGVELADKCAQLDPVALIGSMFNEGPDECFWPIITALKTSTARSWNHNLNQGKPSYHIAGFNGQPATSGFLPGQDDGVVAFHSACGFREIFNSIDCVSDWKYCPVWYNPFRTCDVSHYSGHYVETARMYGLGYDSGARAYDRTHMGGVLENVKRIGMIMTGHGTGY